MRDTTRNLKFAESVHLKCLFYYFKVCGLAPVNHHIHAINSANVNRWTFTHTYVGTVYNLLLICCIIVWSYMNMKENYYKNSNLGFDGTVYAVVDTYSICNTVCIVLIFCMKQTKLIVTFGKMNSTREFMMKNDDSNSKSNTLLYRIMIFTFINIVFWIFLIITILMYEYDLAISFSAPTFCIFIRNALTLQYCISLKLIENLFDALNKNLNDLSNYFASPPEVTSVDTVVVNKKLSQIWEWYSMLHKLTRDIADFYSWPMLLNILCEFLMTITITYYVSKPLIFGNSELTSLDYVNSFAFIFIHVYPMILLTTSVDRAVNKSKIMTEVINDYMKDTEVQITKDKLLHFSIYLLHNEIGFTVFDLFSLDGSLLVSVTGSVTTYLVILLQFQPPASAKSIAENAYNSSSS